MIGSVTRRGQPLLFLVLLIGGWVSARAMMWEPGAAPHISPIAGKTRQAESLPPRAAIRAARAMPLASENILPAQHPADEVAPLAQQPSSWPELQPSRMNDPTPLPLAPQQALVEGRHIVRIGQASRLKLRAVYESEGDRIQRAVVSVGIVAAGGAILCEVVHVTPRICRPIQQAQVVRIDL